MLLDQLFQMPPATNVLGLLTNLLITAALSSLLAWHYVKFGRTMTNREALARILPFIALTTVLVITVVQTSLALALGLVGALSIVRFRTPIKEPEELAYLFMAIALGLGLGANHRMLTTVAFATIVGFMMIWSRRGARGEPHHLYLNIEVNSDGGEVTYDTVQQVLSEHVSVADLRRLDSDNGTLHATFYIDCQDERAVLGAVDSLKRRLPHASISLVDRQQSLGL